MKAVGFRMAGFMLSGSGIKVFVHGSVELGWGGWGKVQFNVGGMVVWGRGAGDGGIYCLVSRVQLSG